MDGCPVRAIWIEFGIIAVKPLDMYAATAEAPF
jgi:hypothetical protein